MTAIDPATATRLFAAVRQIKGSGLTQADVDLVNKALMTEIAAVAADGMRTSAVGVSLIQSFETLKLTTYPDPGPTGKPVTGGWGSTRDENGRPFALGFTAPKEYWDRLFVRDLGATEIGVNLLTRGHPITQNQFDALVSFAYNVGLDIDDDTIAEGLGDSTLLKRHLAGDYAGAKAQFAAWNKSNGKVLNGLIRRRAAEAVLYGAA